MRRLVILILGLSALLSSAATPAQQPAPDQPAEKSAPKTPTRVRAGGQVMNKKIAHKVRPDYPREAKRHGVQGIVRLEVLIGRDGKVLDVKTLKGDPLLVGAATEAVRRWRYKITTIQGQPVEVVTEVDVNFKLK